MSLALLLSGCDASVTLIANRPPTQPRVADINVHVVAGARSGTIHDVTGSCGQIRSGSAASKAPGEVVISIPGFTGELFAVSVPTILADQAGGQGEDAFVLAAVIDRGPGTYAIDPHGSLPLAELIVGSTVPVFGGSPAALGSRAWLASSGRITIDPGENSGSIDVVLRPLAVDPKAAQPLSSAGPADAHITGTFNCVDLTQTGSGAL